jgi:carbamoyltransferase
LNAPPLTLGISGYYHDSAAALLSGPVVIAAAQEERFTRKKFDAGFPTESIRYCLREARAGILDVDRIVFYDKPFLKFDRILETYLACAPRGFRSFQSALPVWLKEKLFLKRSLVDELARLEPGTELAQARKIVSQKLGFSEHHLSHAASAFYPSPFDEAAVLVLDGVGEWATASLFFGSGRRLEPRAEIRFPHSLGLLYSTFTAYCGFKVNSGEYKLMGLAPYGMPRYAELIRRELVAIGEDGSFRLNMRYFDFGTGLRMMNTRFEKLLGGLTRLPEQPIEQRHKDIAASVQAVTEEILLKMTRKIAGVLPTRNLCLAGGVALNCVANGKILRDARFERLWVQPAAGDAGGALGAAYVGYHLGAKQEREKTGLVDRMQGSFLGPGYSAPEIRAELERAGARFHELGDVGTTEHSARLLAEGKALGWFQGRMEFGPRALGSRSILADPRGEKTQSQLNLKIKFRESFRPFAPAVLREDLEEWFDLNVDSPYMLVVSQVKRLRIPAVTHVDGSARVQTVHRETQPLFHSLISRFKEQTGCPVLVNTSFNVRGEPIVNTPAEAFRCFMGTDLDALAIGGFLLHKSEQDPRLRDLYHHRLEMD